MNFSCITGYMPDWTSNTATGYAQAFSAQESKAVCPVRAVQRAANVLRTQIACSPKTQNWSIWILKQFEQMCWSRICLKQLIFLKNDSSSPLTCLRTPICGLPEMSIVCKRFQARLHGRHSSWLRETSSACSDLKRPSSGGRSFSWLLEI